MCKINVSQETHHIKEQYMADDDGFIGYLPKNKKCNLMPLCKECHAKITQGKIITESKIMTSEGVDIKTHKIDDACVKSKKKFNSEDIFNIRKWKNDNMSNLVIQDKFKTLYDKSISFSTISKIIKNKY